MKTYSKWTARVALATLLVGSLLFLSAIPSATGSPGHRLTIWPLSPGYGHTHGIACVELLVGYVILGIVIAFGMVVSIYNLLVRAEWVK